MNEWKVVSPEQSKKLIGLGIVLDTEKYWYDLTRGETPKLISKRIDTEFGVALGDNVYPAPDVAELGMLLPDNDYVPDVDIVIWRSNGVWNLELAIFGEHETEKDIIVKLYETVASTEAQARGAALIWLLENTKYKLEGLNE